MKIAADLTPHQQAELKHYQDLGMVAYYKNGRLRVENQHNTQETDQYANSENTHNTDDEEDRRHSSHYQPHREEAPYNGQASSPTHTKGDAQESHMVSGHDGGSKHTFTEQDELNTQAAYTWGNTNWSTNIGPSFHQLGPTASWQSQETYSEGKFGWSDPQSDARKDFSHQYQVPPFPPPPFPMLPSFSMQHINMTQPPNAPVGWQTNWSDTQHAASIRRPRCEESYSSLKHRHKST